MQIRVYIAKMGHESIFTNYKKKLKVLHLKTCIYNSKQTLGLNNNIHVLYHNFLLWTPNILICLISSKFKKDFNIYCVTRSFWADMVRCLVGSGQG